MEDWHRQQFAEPKRATVALREFARKTLRDGAVRTVLDAGCGSGQNIPHLASLWPGALWTGVDRDRDLLKQGRSLLNGHATLEARDLTALKSVYGDDQFDVTFSIMVLSWLPRYEEVMEQMLGVTSRCIFITSLFSESDLDAYTQVTGEDYRAHYNVYSLPRFQAFCRSHGAEIIAAQPYEIDVDLPRPDHGRMQTYTEALADGRRVQFSGPVWMQWWMLAVVPKA